VVLTIEKPVAPDWLPSVAEVVLRPVGVTQVPLAVVQYRNWIEPMLAVVAVVNPNRWLTIPPGFDPPSELPACSVRLRAVICAAEAGRKGNEARATVSAKHKPIPSQTLALPLKLMREY
jgi:hypothetical protein